MDRSCSCAGAVLAVAVGWFLSGCAWNANAAPRSSDLGAETVTVPACWRTDRPVVSVTVGSRGPFRFLIDTGAECSALSPECARALKVEVVRRSLFINAAGAGSNDATDTATIGELRLGGARFFGIPVFIADMHEDIDGVLGFPVFADVLLTLDGPGSRIVLERGRLRSESDDAALVELVGGDSQHECARVRGRIGGQRALILVDSGFSGALYFARNIPEEHALRFVPDSVQATSVQTHRDTREVVTGRLDDKVVIGPFEREGLRAMVGGGPPVILGGKILRQLVTTFDQRSRRVRIVDPQRQRP